MIKEWDFLVKISYHERQGIQKMLETNTKVNKTKLDAAMGCFTSALCGNYQ
jgi:hypothetical protein